MEPTSPLVAEAARSERTLDLLGIGFSLLCLVHCLALPLLLALLPLAATRVFADEAFHKWMLLGVVPVSMLALATAVVRRRAWALAVLGAFGVALIAYAAYGHELAGLGLPGETVLTVAGALLLATAHLINARASGLLHWHRRGERHR